MGTKNRSGHQKERKDGKSNGVCGKNEEYIRRSRSSAKKNIEEDKVTSK